MFEVLYAGFNEDVTHIKADISQMYVDLTHAVLFTIHGQ